MTDHPRFPPTYDRMRSHRWSRVLVAGTFLSVALACDRELSPEETSFHQRAAEIKVGDTLETVKRNLGEPARVFAAEAECAKSGGRKEWVYDSFVSGGARKRLRGGSYDYCADVKDIVVAVLLIKN